ncbi:hypothetical protein ACFVFS_31060 [Kitasatospora sp. NPDC057692]|uniref:hypothetical protein n=1 Tax=Kitasatospora sp. NPDC057692 TaxID=3346215 RepID=UPI00367953AC
MTARPLRAFSRTPLPTPSEAPVRTLAQLAARTAARTAALTAALTAVLTGVLAGSLAGAPTAPAAAALAPREVNQGYSIPVGAITDLGALPVLGGLGLDFARLLGV